MPKIEIRRNESIDKALRKFKTRMRREGIVDEMRKREFYEKPSQRKRRQLEQARRRAHRNTGQDD